MPYLFITMALLALGTTSSLQAFSEVALKDHAEAFATAAAPASEKYNFKLGPVTTDVAGKFEAEYNDNISLTDSGKVDDTILRFGITSKTVWPITELNSLSLDIDAAYRYYLDNTELNSNENFLDISPGSELALKWWIKDFSFKIYDQFSYSIDSADARVFDPTSSTILNNVTDFGRIENRAGLDVLWDLNDLKVYAGYARDTVNTDDAEFSSLDRNQDSVYLTPMLMLNPSFSVGLASSYFWNDYTDDIQNDGHGFALGPTAMYQLTQNTSVKADLLWKRTFYDENGTNGDVSDLNTWNGSVGLDQELNEFFAHSLVIGRESSFSGVANTQTVNFARYLPTYQLRENLALKGRLVYEDGKDSPADNSESYIRRIYGLGLGYNLSEKLSIDASYDFIKNTSNVASRNYEQNRVLLTVIYDF